MKYREKISEIRKKLEGQQDRISARRRDRGVIKYKRAISRAARTRVIETLSDAEMFLGQKEIPYRSSKVYGCTIITTPYLALTYRPDGILDWKRPKMKTVQPEQISMFA